jgi:hypothetical protein
MHFFVCYMPCHLILARRSVVGWGTMLQARRSQVRVPDEVDFFNLPNPSSHTMALGLTQLLTEMRIFLGVKTGRCIGLTASPPSVSQMSENVGTSTSRNPKGLHGLYRDNFTLPSHPILPKYGRFSYNNFVCTSLPPVLHALSLSSWITDFFFLWLHSPSQALAASMELSISLQLLDLGQMMSLLQGLYLYTNTQKRTHNTNTKHLCPEGDSNPWSWRPCKWRQFMP